MASKLTAKERERIVALLGEGMSQNAVAREVGRSPGLVNKVAREEGIVNIHAPKKANAARREFAREDRMALIGYALRRGGLFLDTELTPQQFKDVMTGLGIGIDKHRLETGEVTGRHEQRNVNHSDDLEGYFRELDRFRSEHGEAGPLEPVHPAEADGRST